MLFRLSAILLGKAGKESEFQEPKTSAPNAHSKESSLSELNSWWIQCSICPVQSKSGIDGSLLIGMIEL